MEERSKRGDSRACSRTLGTVAVEAVKGQRGDRYTRAQMMEGGDECILSREKPGIRNIRLGRGIKGREYVSTSCRRPVESRCERAFRIYKAVLLESTRAKEERERERRERKSETENIYYSFTVEPSKTRNNCRTYAYVNNLQGNSNKS